MLDRAKSDDTYPERLWTPPLVWERADGSERITGISGTWVIEYVAASPLLDRAEHVLCRSDCLAGRADAEPLWMAVYRGAEAPWSTIQSAPAKLMHHAAWLEARQVFAAAVGLVYNGPAGSAERGIRARRVLHAMGTAACVTAGGADSERAEQVAELVAVQGRPFLTELLAKEARSPVSVAIAHRNDIPAARAIVRSVFLAGVAHARAGEEVATC